MPHREEMVRLEVTDVAELELVTGKPTRPGGLDVPGRRCGGSVERMTLVDARLTEMQFLARLDRDGPIIIHGPYDGGRERQMVISLIEHGYVNGIDSYAGMYPAYLLMQAASDARTAEIWQLLKADEKPVKVEIRISHRGRVRLSELMQQVRTGRDRDPTGLLWAKRHLLPDLAIAILSASDSTPLSVAFLDMNGLKSINDTHGHDAGDHAIRVFFQAAIATLGEGRDAYLNGGDEVVVVLPNITDEQAGKLSDGFVHQLGKEIVFLGKDSVATTLTASCGAASTMSPNEDAASFLKRADAAQYRAKAVSKARDPRVSARAVADGEVSTHSPVSEQGAAPRAGN